MPLRSGINLAHYGSPLVSIRTVCFKIKSLNFAHNVYLCGSCSSHLTATSSLQLLSFNRVSVCFLWGKNVIVKYYFYDYWQRCRLDAGGTFFSSERKFHKYKTSEAKPGKGSGYKPIKGLDVWTYQLTERQTKYAQPGLRIRPRLQASKC
jgi:hypothetical protein